MNTGAPRRRKAYSASFIAVGLVVAGFVTIGLAWRSLAALLWVPTQIAYAVSGGLAGIAMIGTGLGVLNIQASRTSGAHRRGELQELINHTVRLLVTLSASPRPPAKGAPEPPQHPRDTA